MAIRAISFDLDDTFWAIDPVIERAEQLLHRWFVERYPRVADRYHPAALRALRDTVAAARPELSHDFTAQRRLALEQAMTDCGYPVAVADAAFDVLWAARNQVQLYPDVLPALESLAQTWPLCALTNGNADIALCGVGQHLRFCVAAREVGVAKPNPAIFATACERFGIAADELLHVGDDPLRDVQGARDAGAHAVWLNRDGLRWPGGGAAPMHVRTLAELPQLLRRWPDAA